MTARRAAPSAARLGRAGLAVVALVSFGAACSGGDEDAVEDEATTTTTTEAEESTTTAESRRTGDEQVAVPTAYRLAGETDYDGFSSVVEGLVADAEHYELTFEDDGFHARVIRFGSRVFNRTAADGAAAAAIPYQQGPAAEVTAVASLAAEASFGPLPSDPGFEPSGAEVALDAIGELLYTDPVALLGEEVRTGAPFEVEVPEDVADSIDALRVDQPELEATAEVEGEALTVELVVAGGSLDLSVTATYTDPGGVGESDLVVPGPDELDATPWQDEEELATFDGTPLVAPATPPPGFALGGVYVLEAFETMEGCREVELDYYEPEDPIDGHVLQLFVLDKRCATGFDPTPFDETTGGLPSRFDGFEIVHGSTVVQVLPSQSQFDLQAFAATLAPTTAEELLASLVPLPG